MPIDQVKIFSKWAQRHWEQIQFFEWSELKKHRCEIKLKEELKANFILKIKSKPGDQELLTAMYHTLYEIEREQKVDNFLQKWIKKKQNFK